jgi:hypothetical protein
MEQPMRQAMTHGSLLTAVLGATIVSAWKVSAVLSTLNSWDGAWQQPKLAADLLQAAVWGLVALGLGLGMNFGALLRGLGVPLPPADNKE